MSCIITYKNNKYTEQEFKQYIKNNFFEFSNSINNISEIQAETSKVKDIVYHALVRGYDFDKFNSELGNYEKAIFFFKNLSSAKIWRDDVHGKTLDVYEKFKNKYKNSEYVELKNQQLSDFVLNELNNILTLYYIRDNPTSEIASTLSEPEKLNEYIKQASSLPFVSSYKHLFYNSYKNLSVEQMKKHHNNIAKILLPLIIELEKKAKIINAIINIKNPEIVKNHDYIMKSEEGENLKNLFRNRTGDSVILENATEFTSSKEKADENKRIKTVRYNGIFGAQTDTLYSMITDTQYAVFEPEQIYILNSDKALQDMEEFMSKKQGASTEDNRNAARMSRTQQILQHGEPFVVDTLPNVPQAEKSKAAFKSSNSVGFIGFGKEGTAKSLKDVTNANKGEVGSSTNYYAMQYKAKGLPVNPVSYESGQAYFASVNGDGYNRERTLQEIEKALNSGAIVMLDSKKYIDSSKYNQRGEGWVYNALSAKGYKQNPVSDPNVTVWYKEPESRDKYGSSVAVDSNGEPEVLYIRRSKFIEDMKKPGDVGYEASFPLTTYKDDSDVRYPVFVNIRNPKMIAVTDRFTWQDYIEATEMYKNSDYDGVVFVKTNKDGTVEKQYIAFNSDQIRSISSFSGTPNTEFNPNDARRMETVRLDKTRELKSIASFLLGEDDSFRILRKIAKSGGEYAGIAKQLLLGASESIRIEQTGGNGITYENGKILVGRDIDIDSERFDIIMLSVLMETALEKKVVVDGDQSFNGIYNTTKVLYQKLQSALPEHLKNIPSYIHGMLTDREFFTKSKDMMLPGGSKTLNQSFVDTVRTSFGLKEDTENPNDLSDFMERGMEARDANRQILFHDEPFVSEEEEAGAQEEGEDNTGAGKDDKFTIVNPEAPYAHLLTGDPILDKYISSTFEKIQALKSRIKKRGKQADNVKLKAEIKKYQKDLNELTERQTLYTLMNVGKKEIMRAKNTLSSNPTHDVIGENMKLMEAWKDFSSYVESEGGAPETLFTVRQISLQALELYNEYKSMYFNSVKQAMTEEGVPIKHTEQLTADSVIQDIGWSSATFTGLSFGENALEIGADRIIRSTAYKINHAFTAFSNKLNKLLEATGSKDISFMFKPDKNGKMRPITRYKRELYEKVNELQLAAKRFGWDNKEILDESRAIYKKRAEASRAGDKAAVEELDRQYKAIQEQIKAIKEASTTFETLNEFMRQNFDYEITEEGVKAYEEFAETFKEAFYDYDPETGQMVFDSFGYEREIEKYNPEALKRWLETGKDFPQFASQFFKVSPKDKWLDDASFSSMSSAQKELYDFFVEEYAAAHAHIPTDFATDYDIDKIISEFAYMDKTTMSKFKYLGKEVKEFFKDIATVKYFDNTVSAAQTGPLSGEPTVKVKFKHIGDFTKTVDGYWKEGEELPESLQKGLNEGRYKYKDGYLVVVSKGAKNEKMVEKIVSANDDPLSIFIGFRNFAFAYQYKSEVEDVLNGIKELAYAQGKNLEKNKGVSNLMGTRLLSKTGSNMEKRLNYTVDAFLSGNLKDPLPGTQKVNPGERAWSGGQMLESLNNFTRARQLGLNLASGVTNLAMGAVNNWVYAGRDEFFNEKELRKAYAIISSSVASFWSAGRIKIGPAQKIMLMMQKLGILENLHEMFYADKEWLDKAFEKLYVLQSGGEYINQGAVMLAALIRKKVKVNGEEVSLWDAYEVKDGELVLKDGMETAINEDTMFVAGEAIKKMNKEIHGDYDPLNPMLAKKQVYGRVGMLFRSWMPQMIKQRFGARYVDYQLSEFMGRDIVREGRWRTAGREVFKPIGSGKFSNLIKFLTATAASTISNAAGRKIIGTMNLSETDRANMNANVKEFWWLIAISIGTSSLLAYLKGDDDDDEMDPQRKSILQYLYNQSARLDTELWFFYSPSSFTTIVKDAIPLWSTLKQGFRVYNSAKTFIFDNEADTYQRGFRKGNSKFATQLQLFFPLVRQGQTLFSMWSQIYSNKYD